MTYLIQPYKDKEVSSVDEAIRAIKEYLYSETPLEVELIYFTTYQSEEELFILNFQLIGFSDRERQSIAVLDEITKDEAVESWITVYK